MLLLLNAIGPKLNQRIGQGINSSSGGIAASIFLYKVIDAFDDEANLLPSMTPFWLKMS